MGESETRKAKVAKLRIPRLPWLVGLGSTAEVGMRAARCPDCGEPLYLVVGMAADASVLRGLSGPLIFACQCRQYPLSILCDTVSTPVRRKYKRRPRLPRA